ncbi:DJ-1/PfpI family protein [Saccharibacillus alkalitolerans]|uniref:Thij/pfpi family protein n=1 Tax=Saccharibacillus alkalitolerans TaxID=2705290 RepID=A0ABX0F3R6_9BACL|nr:DJ-1/PfpI family protein [Saccharibacillus alkalitolerans]NGZ75606.1 thij/pfpi family protein [Saccharibacillus alkalitolerans]
MKTYILVYNGFAQFEVMLAAHLMKTAGEIVTVGLSTDPVVSHEGFRIVPHMTIERVEACSVDLFIVPGGDLSQISRRSEVENLLKAVQACGGKVGAICSGTMLALDAGLARGRNFTSPQPADPAAAAGSRLSLPVVSDSGLVTAQAYGYVDFALELGRLSGIYRNEADYEETVRFFKFFMPPEEPETAEYVRAAELRTPAASETVLAV